MHHSQNEISNVLQKAFTALTFRRGRLSVIDADGGSARPVPMQVVGTLRVWLPARRDRTPVGSITNPNLPHY